MNKWISGFAGWVQGEWKSLGLLLLLALGLIVYYFQPSLLGGQFLGSGDYNYTGVLANKKFYDALPFFDYIWDQTYTLGQFVGRLTLSVEPLVSRMFDAGTAYRVQNFFPFLLLALAMFLMLRGLGFSGWIAVPISLFTAFSPAHFSFVNPGHISKLYTVVFFPVTLYFVNRILVGGDRSILTYLLAGFSLGAAYVNGESPVSFYFSIVLVGYVLTFSDWRQIKGQWSSWVKWIFIPFAAVAIAYPVLIQQAGVAFDKTKGESIPTLVKEKKSDPNSWDWATQWSFPPEETVDLFAPGIFGTQTGDPEAPYWGRTGRSAEWTAENRVGFQNFSSTSSYLGFFVFFFALLAVVFVRNRLVLFWGIICALAILFAFGKHFPLYWVLYQFPFVNKFRNPNRFLHLVYLSAGILAAFGLRFFLESFREAGRELVRRQSLAFARNFMLISLGLGFLGLLVVFFANSNLVEYFTRVYDESTGEKIVSNIYGGLWRWIFLSGLAGAGLWFLGRLMEPSTRLFGVLWLLILGIGLVDISLVNKKYLRFYDAEAGLQKDALTSFLAESQTKEPSRYKLASRGPYLNHFLNNLTPVYRIQTFDVPAARSFPADLETYMNLENGNTLRFYDLLNVRHFLSEAPLNLFGLLPKYQVGNLYEPGKSIYIYENEGAVPRVRLVHRATVETNTDGVFATLNSKLYQPKSETLLVADKPFLKELSGSARVEGDSVEFVKYVDHEIKVKTVSKEGGILVLADHFDPEWEAKVDGKSSPIFRADYLMRGVYLPAGSHEIVFQVKRTFFYNTLPFLFLALFLVCLLLFLIRKPSASDSSAPA